MPKLVKVFDLVVQELARLTLHRWLRRALWRSLGGSRILRVWPHHKVYLRSEPSSRQSSRPYWSCHKSRGHLGVKAFYDAMCAFAWAEHKKCHHEQSHCLHRCALVRDLGGLPDKAWHRCNAKCSGGFATCEQRCLTRWSCGGLVARP